MTAALLVVSLFLIAHFVIHRIRNKLFSALQNMKKIVVIFLTVFPLPTVQIARIQHNPTVMDAKVFHRQVLRVLAWIVVLQ
jgi:hypothetical protein